MSVNIHVMKWSPVYLASPLILDASFGTQCAGFLAYEKENTVSIKLKKKKKNTL